MGWIESSFSISKKDRLLRCLTSPYVSFVLLAFVGLLFSYKYAVRVSVLLIPLYVCLVVGVYYVIFKWEASYFSEITWIRVLLLTNLAIVIVGGIAFHYIHVEELDVDRWSVITHYWDAYLDGNNPYSSFSHMGNHYGSYPFYFILALPFYLIGELGWISILGLLVIEGFVYWRFKRAWPVFVIIALSLMSLSMPYEIMTRSTLFANASLVLMAIYYFNYSWRLTKIIHLTLSSCIVGLLVCTRPVFGLVFLIAGIYLIREYFDLEKAITVFLVSSFAFLLPFIHLYLLYPHSILENNPISYMTENFVPTWFYAIYLLASIALGFTIKHRHQIIPICGIYMIFVVICYALYHISMKGWSEAIFNHYIDITYFFMAVPFLVFTVAQYRLREMG